MKYVVLGKNSFVGKHLYQTLKETNKKVVSLDKNDFDITNYSTYNKYDFSNSIIIDCIASIDSDEQTIYKTNYLGLKQFITYLNSKKYNFKYIYFSTTSTQIEKEQKKTSYIASKLLAEEYISSNVYDYQIIRLTFPFGKGENKNRFISKLISKIKLNQKITINNVIMNLTPISFLQENFINLLESTKKEINFTDGKVYHIKDIVESLYKLLKIEPNYTYNNSEIHNLCTSNEQKVICNINLFKDMIDE